jgi:hypothetical protein
LPVAEKVIHEAVARYGRERDRYIKLADHIADLCRSAVVKEHAIRAQVTSRTKTVRIVADFDTFFSDAFGISDRGEGRLDACDVAIQIDDRWNPGTDAPADQVCDGIDFA